jgi:hypothetical protein
MREAVHHSDHNFLTIGHLAQRMLLSRNDAIAYSSGPSFETSFHNDSLKGVSHFSDALGNNGGRGLFHHKERLGLWLLCAHWSSRKKGK